MKLKPMGTYLVLSPLPLTITHVTLSALAMLTTYLFVSLTGLSSLLLERVSAMQHEDLFSRAPLLVEELSYYWRPPLVPLWLLPSPDDPCCL